MDISFPTQSKTISASVVHSAKDACIVLSNATPGNYDELKLMDEQFYKTHRVSQWRRSMLKQDIVASTTFKGFYQYKYLSA